VNVVVTSAIVFGPAAAAPTPCAIRAAISRPAVGARPPARDATVNRATPPTNRRRRPKVSPARPPSRSRPPKVSVYALMTHDRFVAEKCRPVWMRGSATFITVASSTSMSWQVTMIARAMPGRAVGRTAASGRAGTRRVWVMEMLPCDRGD
jgi:hypothetical protein